MTNSIEKVEKELGNLKYTSNKSEILIYILKYFISRKNFKYAEKYIKKFISTIDLEPNILARSKIINESINTLFKSLKCDDFKSIESIMNKLIPKIEVPYYKIQSWLEKLKFLSFYANKNYLLEEIKKIEAEIENIFKINTIIMLNWLFKPKNIYLSPEILTEYTSIDSINKKFVIYSSEIAVHLLDENLIKFAIQRAQLIKFQILRDETLKEIINNYYLLAIKTNNKEIALRVNELSKIVEDDVFRAETFVNYSDFLYTKSRFDEIEELLDFLILLIQKTPGDFSRASLFKTFIKIIQNLDNKSKKIQYHEKIYEMITKYQDNFSSLIIKLELLKSFYNLKRFKAGKELFKEIILQMNLISNQDLFLKINQQLIDLLSDINEMIDEDLISFYISKLNELDDNCQKTKILSNLTIQIENMNLHEKLKDIEKIMALISKPYVSNNKIFTEQYFLYLKFLIKQAFRFNYTKIIENPLQIVEKAHSEVEKCLLLLELLNQNKLKEQKEQSDYYNDLFFKQLKEITNEFERKEVLINYFNLIFLNS